MTRSATKTGPLGDCNRCIEPTRATTIERFTTGVGKIELRLCDPCADRFQNAMFAWVRIGTIMDERPQTLRAPVRREPEPSRRGTVVWSYLAVPEVVSTTQVAETEPDVEEIPIRTLVRTRLERAGWTCSEHAEDRILERDVPVDEVLWCLARPDTVTPSTSEQYADCIVHQRGTVRVVIDPNRKTILTVMYREREEYQSA